MNRHWLEHRDGQDTYLRERNRKRRARYALVHGGGADARAEDEDTVAAKPPPNCSQRHYTPGLVALSLLGYVVRGDKALTT